METFKQYIDRKKQERGIEIAGLVNSLGISYRHASMAYRGEVEYEHWTLTEKQFGERVVSDVKYDSLMSSDIMNKRLAIADTRGDLDPNNEFELATPKWIDEDTTSMWVDNCRIAAYTPVFVPKGAWFLHNGSIGGTRSKTSDAALDFSRYFRNLAHNVIDRNVGIEVWEAYKEQKQNEERESAVEGYLYEASRAFDIPVEILKGMRK